LPVDGVCVAVCFQLGEFFSDFHALVF
jgi:hypothetical protein